MNVEVTVTAVALQGLTLYTEWVGTLTGSVNGGENMTGVALFEAFKLTA
jgi:hypothetical protein